MHRLNPKTQLVTSVLTAVVIAAPTVLPLDTLTVNASRWVAGVLALVMVALSAYQVFAAQPHD